MLNINHVLEQQRKIEAERETALIKVEEIETQLSNFFINELEFFIFRNDQRRAWSVREEKEDIDRRYWALQKEVVWYGEMSQGIQVLNYFYIKWVKHRDKFLRQRGCIDLKKWLEERRNEKSVVMALFFTFFWLLYISTISFRKATMIPWKWNSHYRIARR